MQSKLQGFFLFFLFFFLRHSLKRSDKWPTTSEVDPFFYMTSLKFLHDELERLQSK